MLLVPVRNFNMVHEPANPQRRRARPLQPSNP
jgi:hypothetical protein